MVSRMPDQNRANIASGAPRRVHGWIVSFPAPAVHAAEGVERLATISTITRYLPRAPSRDAPDRHRCGRGTNTDTVLLEDGQIRAPGQDSDDSRCNGRHHD